MKMKRLIIILLCFVSLVSCTESRDKLARRTFDNAIEAYMQRKFNKSKILLDSVLYTYPDIKDVCRESRDMLEVIYKTEQERNLLFLDSLLNIREQEIVPIMEMFETEDPQSAAPVLVHKKQVATRAWDRCYLRAHVDKNGTFYVSSHYTGNGHINHYAVRVQTGDIFQQTDSISDDAYMNSFEIDGTAFENIKFKNGTDNGIASLIATNFDKPIDVYLIGEKTKYKFRLTETDCIAFRDTYHLALMLRETVQIKSQIRNVKMMMRKKQDANAK